ncbi:hypothetical protein MKX01_015141, partial [Papaver californicum]
PDLEEELWWNKWQKLLEIINLRMYASYKQRKEKIMASENDDVSVSVSFGKFENDLLSWDKWSSFSQNKYLEEVEKCSTPGSVASKKAYFEAHYKKIAAHKAAAELLEVDSVTSNCPSHNGKQAQDEDDTFEFDLGRRNQTQGFRKCQLSLIHAAESNQDTDGVDCQDSVSQVSKEEMHSQQHNFTAGDLEASSVSRQGETPDKKSKTETEELETSISVQGVNQQGRHEHNVRNTEMHIQQHNLETKELEASVSCRGEFPDEKSKTETKELETSTSAQGENQQRSQKHNAGNTEMHSQQHNLQTEELEASVSVQLENPLERSMAQTEEVVLIEEKNCYNESHANVEEVPILIKEENQSVSLPPASVHERVEVETYSGRTQSDTSIGHVEEIETTKLKQRKGTRKVHSRIPATKEKIPARTMRNLVTPKIKTAKPSPSSPTISTYRTPLRKDSSPSLLKNKQLVSADNKGSTSSTSLHMSLNAPPVKSHSSFLNTTRRSLIMEQMGDKEIIKRAFKAFKNTYGTSLSSGEGTSSTFQQLSEHTFSSTFPQKDKNGTGMSLGKASPYIKQLAARTSSLSASPVRPTAGMKQTITKASTTSPFKLRSDVKAGKHKEVMKTNDVKLKATEVDKPSRLRSKSKDVAYQTLSWR